MRSFQEDHEMRERAVGAPNATGTPDPPPPAPAATRIEGSKPETTLRTNITIAVVILCVVLIALIAVNSGSNVSESKPHALVILLDGAAGDDIQRAVGLLRAPFLGLVGDLGVTTLTLPQGMCSTRSTSSEELVRELAFGQTKPNTSSVLQTATKKGYSVGLLGAYPLVSENVDLCSAISTECATHCREDAPKCNYRTSRVITNVQDFVAATVDSTNNANYVTIARIPIAVDNSANILSRDSGLFLADAAMGRAIMSVFGRTGSNNENLLVVVAAASPGSTNAFLAFAAFRGATALRLAPLSRPVRLGDAAATLARWLDVPYSGGTTPVAICSSGAVASDCA
jgi:hypothetical protein